MICEFCRNPVTNSDDIVPLSSDKTSHRHCFESALKAYNTGVLASKGINSSSSIPQGLDNCPHCGTLVNIFEPYYRIEGTGQATHLDCRNNNLFKPLTAYTFREIIMYVLSTHPEDFHEFLDSGLEVARENCAASIVFIDFPLEGMKKRVMDKISNTELPNAHVLMSMWCDKFGMGKEITHGVQPPSESEKVV